MCTVKWWGMRAATLVLYVLLIGYPIAMAQTGDCTNTLLFWNDTAVIDGEEVFLDTPFPEDITGWELTPNVYYTQQTDDDLMFYRVLPDGTPDLTIGIPLSDDTPQYTRIAPMPDEDFVVVSEHIINMYAEGSERTTTILLWVIDVEEKALLTTEPVLLEFEAMDHRSLVSLLDMSFSPDGSLLLVESISQPQEQQLGVMPTECLLDGSSTCFVDFIDFDPTTTRYNGYWLADGSGDIIHQCRGTPGICRANIETETITQFDLPLSGVRNMAYLPCENAIAGWQYTGNDSYMLFTYDLDDDTLTPGIYERERHAYLYVLPGDIPEAWMALLQIRSSVESVQNAFSPVEILRALP